MGDEELKGEIRQWRDQRQARIRDRVMNRRKERILKAKERKEKMNVASKIASAGVERTKTIQWRDQWQTGIHDRVMNRKKERSMNAEERKEEMIGSKIAATGVENKMTTPMITDTGC